VQGPRLRDPPETRAPRHLPPLLPDRTGRPVASPGRHHPVAGREPAPVRRSTGRGGPPPVGLGPGLLEGVPLRAGRCRTGHPVRRAEPREGGPAAADVVVRDPVPRGGRFFEASLTVVGCAISDASKKRSHPPCIMEVTPPTTGGLQDAPRGTDRHPP